MTAIDHREPRVRIWDPAVRLFHWALVALLAFSWWTGDHHDMERHRFSGYAILGLVVFRLYWGLAGSRTARFAHFLRGPGALVAYAASIVGRRHRPSAGHNPIGGWSVALMLATLAVMVGSGLFAVDVDGLESGPLSDRLSFEAGRIAARLHHWCFNALLALVALHVVAILAYLVLLRANLIAPMIHGRAAAGSPRQDAPLAMSWWRAGVGVAIAAALAWAVSRGLRV